MALVADHDKVSFQNLPERLKVWGGELFGDSLDLDVLIAKTASLRSKLSAPLAAQLVEIAVEQELIMEAWIPISTEGRRRELIKAASALRHVLITNITSDEILPDTMYQPLNHKSAFEDDGVEQGQLDPDYLIAMVDILFDYLPAINRLRRTHILQMERMTAPNTQQRSQSIAVESHERPETTGPHSAHEEPASADMSATTRLIGTNNRRVPESRGTLTLLIRGNTTEVLPSIGEPARTSKNENAPKIATPIEDVIRTRSIASENALGFEGNKAQTASLARQLQDHNICPVYDDPMDRFLRTDEDRFNRHKGPMDQRLQFIGQLHRSEALMKAQQPNSSSEVPRSSMPGT
ncbi:hypothetical protein CKM354_001137700 [Cercospora kikuchii]|uniref:Uncharacterized protein n=1 Tax=Cercospora kikuchii TaxID=84275 RepID=A0A9P3CYE8_9PEZI|nr:uncharacterized protein CKM354_001137700 [Cercospora kikuchii]GIZ48310.1 hypothetical protein CKM354_001137700 [Cercospora kikuchii]